MLWIYLSPHFDDVALSCGGLVWEQVQAGDSVSIWTVCSGNAPGGELSPFAEELLLRWEADQDATAQRRLEDIHSCQRLEAISITLKLTMAVTANMATISQVDRPVKPTN